MNQSGAPRTVMSGILLGELRDPNARDDLREVGYSEDPVMWKLKIFLAEYEGHNTLAPTDAVEFGM